MTFDPLEMKIIIRDLTIGLQKARRQLVTMRAFLRSEKALPSLIRARRGLDLAHVESRIAYQKQWIDILRNDLTGARNYSLRGWNPTLSGAGPRIPSATMTGEEMLQMQRGAEAAARRRAAAQTARSAGRARWLGMSVPVAVTLVAVLAIVAVGLYANSRQSSVLEQSRLLTSGPEPQDPFIGPEAPGDTCIGDVAGQLGLLWTEQGWRAPAADPQPLLSGYPDNDEGYTAYLAAMDAWELRIRSEVAEALVDAESECGVSSGPTDPRDVSVVVLDNVSGGTLWIGWLEDLEGARACDFSGGGLCFEPAAGEPGPPEVQYHVVAGPFPDVLVAEQAYCDELAGQSETSMALTGGSKVDVYGGSYWTDYMPECAPATN